MGNEKGVNTLEQRMKLAHLFRQLTEEKFGSGRQLSEASGINAGTTASLLRGPTEQATFTHMVGTAYALDLPLYEVARLLNLDERVKELMRTPKYSYRYNRLKWMIQGTGEPAYNADPLGSILSDIPDKNKEIARKLILSVLDQMRE